MGMRIPAINFQFPINCASQPIVRNHPAHCALDQPFWVPGTARTNVLGFVAADIAGKAHVDFLFFFFSGQSHFIRVDYDDEIARVHMWSENCLSFAAQQVGSRDRDATKHLVSGVDEPPLTGYFAGFGGKRFLHGRKGTKATGDAGSCQPAQ
jgi:hypothetical protein